MFNNELMSDVHFVVGMKEVSERIPAHKYVLTTGSPVFYAMFYGGLAGDNGADIEIPDVAPIAFCTLLKYIYCDMIDLNTDNVLATLYAAKKYIIPHLARACVTFVETSLTTHNACLLLSQSKLFEEPELMHRCWEVIDAQTSMAIASDGFTDIDFETLMSLLGRETLNVKELDLFEAAIKWGEVKCIRNDMEPTAKNKRKVLGDALNLIRIPAMKLEEFANGVAQSGILTSQETTEIFLNYTASNFSAKFTLFSSKPRKGFNGKGVQGGHIAD
ncbi:BTBD6 (predicted) [Pycnogonum litorale]